LVSASLLGVSPNVDYFLSPVTISEPAEAFSNIGGALSAVYLFLLGYCFGRCTRGRPRGWLAQAFCAYVAFGIFLVMGRGELAYALINMTSVALLLATIVALSALFGRSRPTRRPFQSRPPATRRSEVVW
jgi:hypothetical protein